MVPGCAIQVRPKLVDECTAWRNGTLRDGRDAIEPRRASLEYAVPMQRSTLVGQVVRDRHLDPAMARELCLKHGWTAYQSPQLASISGPGKAPLISRPFLTTPSGAIFWYETVKS